MFDCVHNTHVVFVGMKRYKVKIPKASDEEDFKVLCIKLGPSFGNSVFADGGKAFTQCIRCIKETRF